VIRRVVPASVPAAGPGPAIPGMPLAPAASALSGIMPVIKDQITALRRHNA
jgi:hypothetical protein